MGYVYGSQCESRCLHLDRISDFLFSKVFCDGWVIIASFWWRQRRPFDVLLLAAASFSISQVMVGEMFMSFRCHMCVDKKVLAESFPMAKESLWLHILCFMVPSVAPMYCLTELLIFTVALYATVYYRQFSSERHVSLSLQLHCLLERVVLWLVSIFLLWPFRI